MHAAGYSGEFQPYKKWIYNKKRKKKIDIHKFDDHLQSSIGQLICSSYAIKPMQKVAKSMQQV